MNQRTNNIIPFPSSAPSTPIMLDMDTDVQPADHGVVIALEASTSAVKAIVYHPFEGVKRVVTHNYPEPVADVISIDPEGMYQALAACTREAAEDFEVHAVGLCGIWHSLLLLDAHNDSLGPGTESRPMTTWAHTGAGAIAAQARQDKDLSKRLYQRTGCMPHSMYPLWQYRNWRRYGDERKVARFCCQPEYLFFRMTGEWAVSRSVASGSGLLNTHTLDWDPDALYFGGIKNMWLSPLREPEYTAPLTTRAARDFRLPEGIPVLIGGPDGALNQLGSGCMDTGLMTFSVGTSGALRLTSPAPLLPDDPSTWCYYLAEGRRIIGAATSGAGNCVDWFVHQSGMVREGFAGLEAPLREVMGNPKRRAAAPVFLPFMFGERCPGWREDRQGGFVEIRANHTLGDFYYALLEGVLMNLYQNYEILKRLAGEPREIRISGGIEHAPQWLQMAADLWNHPLDTSMQQHASTMGVIALLLKQQQHIKRLEDFEAPTGARVLPDAELEHTDLMESRFAKFQAQYRKG